MASSPVTTAPASETTPAHHGPLGSPEPPRWHSGSAFFWGVVLILVAGFLAWLLIGYFGTRNFEDLDQKRVKERYEILQKSRDADDHLLNDPPSYLDKTKGKIRIPLQRAMELALKDLQASKPRAAYPMTGDHAPQPAAAPTSPDKGAGSPKDGNINPSASNPTVGAASPAPAAAQSPTPVPPSTTATPPPANAPAPSATPQVGTAATGTPAPSPAPAATNNALNPGNAPAPGAQPQPSPSAPGNTETGGGSPTPASGAQPQPLTSPATPPPAPAASSQNTPSPNPKEPGVTPGGTP